MEEQAQQAKSIDEQLAEANKRHDERLREDAKQGKGLATADPDVTITPKPMKAETKPAFNKAAVGNVAHQHYFETETELVSRACRYVNHQVNDRKGLTINEKLYLGKVVVPQCVANTLSELENRIKMAERGVYEDRGRQILMGEFKG